MSENKHLEFIKSLATYFMDFLETDFHKRRLPRRMVRLKTSENLLVGVSVDKYQRLKQVIWDLLNQNFSDGNTLKISKGAYTNKLPENISGVLNDKVAQISAQLADSLVEKLNDTIKSTCLNNQSNYDKAYSETKDNCQAIINKHLIKAVMSDLEPTLVSLDSVKDTGLYIIEVELTELVYKMVEDSVNELIKHFVLNQQDEGSVSLSEALNCQKLTSTLQTYFAEFSINDVYSEIYEIYKNKFILDKQDLYLYFYTINFDREKYPIFYLPFEVKMEGNTLILEFDSQLYINKKAIEFAVQEFNTANESAGKPKLPEERIIYLHNDATDVSNIVGSYIAELVRFFNLDASLDTSNPLPEQSRSLMVTIANNSFISLFDKSDESLINDYEALLALLSNDNAELAEGFKQLINDFIYHDPIVINSAVRDEWDGVETEDKLIFETPIPLNSEQRQILMALNKPDCKYISVEGPPGTGKSHTITALVFDAILKNKSVLVLSDKKEALDVVEEKITSTMNKVRVDENFQNPILRLGKTGSTYSQILSKSSIDKINNHYRAVKKNYSELEQDIDTIKVGLRDIIRREIDSYKKISIDDIHELVELENEIPGPERFGAFIKNGGTAEEIIGTYNTFKKLQYFLIDKQESKLTSMFKLKFSDFKTVDELGTFVKFLDNIFEIFAKLNEVYKNKVNLLAFFKQPLTEKDITILSNIYQELQRLRKPIVGYLFSKKEVGELSLKFKQFYPYINWEDIQAHKAELSDCIGMLAYVSDLRQQLSTEFKEYRFDIVETLTTIVFSENLSLEVQELSNLFTELSQVKEFLDHTSNLDDILKIHTNSLSSLTDNQLTKMPDSQLNKLARLVQLQIDVEKDFKGIPFHSFLNEKKLIEELTTTKMTYLMDKRVIDFYENKKNTAETLRSIIKNKKTFDKDKFEDVKEAFPCILAGIRDYAEYIPLEPGLFDLVIIDEASQVSIAQAFPALLRAKKVIVFGDNKQFSNVKSALAKTDINQIYINNLHDAFIKNVSNEQFSLERLAKFNIKTSILDFFYHISNFNIQLKKHFRGYPELISYSNKYFYQNSLEVLKIRGKPITEVLKLDIIKHDNKKELIDNTNIPEANRIIEILENLKDNSDHQSVGIITPHTNQQKLIWNKINQNINRSYFIDTLKTKVMTFDTCQGEERDLILYSMVATKEDDKLNHIFIRDLNDIDYEDDSSIKAQRLNVGFSRCKECMHFILSKETEGFNGAIGEAIRHYAGLLESVKKNDTISTQTDKNSPMEAKLLNYIQQTDFYLSSIKASRIEVKPQFKLGEYLKQLDSTYNHPDYVVDFLVLYTDEVHSLHKFIIEYDGFEYHFAHKDDVNKFNYDFYYTEDDVYREKVLESYGYKFLRFNKFNLKDNPIETINQKLNTLLNNKLENSPSRRNVMEVISKTYENIENGNIRACKKCGEYKDISEFRDDNLVTKYGIYCVACKTHVAQPREIEVGPTNIQISNLTCPKCKAKMILRSGKYGKFYGCSKFPYCRGTRPY